MEPAQRVARAMQTLMRGLTFVSESDFPYGSFWAPFPKSEELTPEGFRAAAAIGPRYKIEFRPLEPWFAYYQDPVGGPGLPPDDVAAYALLQKMITAFLSDSALIWVGGTNVVHVRVFIVGRVDDGNLAGLRTVSIET